MTAFQGENKALPFGFTEVALSRATGWTYWEVVTQPTWFIEKLSIYMKAEEIHNKIKAHKMRVPKK